MGTRRPLVLLATAAAHAPARLDGMLVVVGSPTFMLGSTPGAVGDAGGLAAGIALAGAAAGAQVELVGRVGDDPAGDAVLLALARGGVGHIATLRDAGRATPVAAPDPPDADSPETASIAALLTAKAASEPVRADRDEAAWPPGAGLRQEPADIALGLRYVRDFRALVVADPLDEPSAMVVADAAAFAGAALVVVVPHGQVIPGGLGPAVLLEAPEADPDGAFAALVGRFAADLDRGADAAEALADAAAGLGWERAAG
jgi:hypothetical protein